MTSISATILLFKELASLVALGGAGTAAMALAFVITHKVWSRSSLDIHQFNALSQSVKMLRDELDRERKDRIAERTEWVVERAALKEQVASQARQLILQQGQIEQMKRQIGNGEAR